MEYDLLKKEKTKHHTGKPFYKNGWVILIIVILIAISMRNMLDNPQDKISTDSIPATPLTQTLGANNDKSISVLPSSNTTTNGGIDGISTADKNRITEIIIGVINGTIPLTEISKRELESLFEKYKLSETEIQWLKIQGPAVVTYCQLLYYGDALLSLDEGVPIKSDNRKYLEDFAVSVGKMTREEITRNDLEIEKIARKEPIISDGNRIVITEDIINTISKETRERVSRIDFLFEKPIQKNTPSQILNVGPSQVDSNFKCPENYTDSETMNADSVKFLADYGNKNPQATVSDYLTYRYSLLVKYDCQKTLDFIKNEANGQDPLTSYVEKALNDLDNN
jgi:hypothetical protein